MKKNKASLNSINNFSAFIDKELRNGSSQFINVDKEIYNMVENTPGGFDFALKLAETSLFINELLSGLSAKKTKVTGDQKERVRRLIFFILKHSGDYENRTTIYAIFLLSCFLEPADYKIGLKYLKNNSPRVVCMALTLLQKLKYKNLNDILTRMAKHGEPLVRQSVADCIEDGLIYNLYPVLKLLSLDSDYTVSAVAKSAKDTLNKMRGKNGQM